MTYTAAKKWLMDNFDNDIVKVLLNFEAEVKRMDKCNKKGKLCKR